MGVCFTILIYFGEYFSGYQGTHADITWTHQKSELKLTLNLFLVGQPVC